VRQAEGVLTISLDAGESLDWEAFDLAEQVGWNDAAPCANFQFAFSWQVTDPYPAADELGLVFRGTRLGATFEIGQGPSGSERPGCVHLEVTNDSDLPIEVEMRVAVDVF
jgi:hypothetical protein